MNTSFFIHFALSSAVTVLRAAIKDPKKYAEVSEYIHEVRSLVDEADDALGGGASQSAVAPA